MVQSFISKWVPVSARWTCRFFHRSLLFSVQLPLPHVAKVNFFSEDSVAFNANHPYVMLKLKLMWKQWSIQPCFLVEHEYWQWPRLDHVVEDLCYQCEIEVHGIISMNHATWNRFEPPTLLQYCKSVLDDSSCKYLNCWSLSCTSISSFDWCSSTGDVLLSKYQRVLNNC